MFEEYTVQRKFEIGLEFSFQIVEEIKSQLNKRLLKYYPCYKGIFIAYKDIVVLPKKYSNQSSNLENHQLEIFTTTPAIYVYAKYKAIIFAPKPGEFIKGKIMDMKVLESREAKKKRKRRKRKTEEDDEDEDSEQEEEEKPQVRKQLVLMVFGFIRGIIEKKSREGEDSGLSFNIGDSITFAFDHFIRDTFYDKDKTKESLEPLTSDDENDIIQVTNESVKIVGSLTTESKVIEVYDHFDDFDDSLSFTAE